MVSQDTTDLHLMDRRARAAAGGTATVKRSDPTADVAVAGTRPVVLSSFTAARREPSRPPQHREPDFASRFDGETFLYDAFPGIDRRIVLTGPPFLNLKDGLADMSVTAEPSGAPCRFEVREMDRHGQIRVEAPDGTDRLVLTTAFGTATVAVSPSEVDLFAGRRVMFTLSRDNDLTWIQDWVRFGRDVHGADAVLIYDNASTRYRPEDLARALASLSGIRVARVVTWPFKYGPQGWDAKRFWDSDFCQHGAWEHGRHRFLAAAASVHCSDVDELLLSPDGESVFEAAETSRTGVLRYAGRWVVGVAGRPPPVDWPDRRHRDYATVLRRRPQRRFGLFTADAERCPPKWTVVPSRCPPRSQWRVHAIGRFPAARLMTNRFSYRHFREINTGWKEERTSRQAFDPACHEHDALLAATMAKVRWDE